LAAGWSKDPKAKVGAVIADRQGRVIALGYNGFAAGIEDSDERFNPRSKWTATGLLAIQMFNEANISFDSVEDVLPTAGAG
jgi:deoxycytidylate deaminase